MRHQPGEPAPLILLLHGAFGPLGWESAYAKRLSQLGFVVAGANFFTARRMTHVAPSVGDTYDEAAEKIRIWVADVLAVLKALSERPEVREDRLGILGWSAGAGIAWLAAGLASADPHGLPVRAAVGYYGFCHPRMVARLRETRAALLVIQAKHDDWRQLMLLARARHGG